MGYSQKVRHSTLTAASAGSNPAGLVRRVCMSKKFDPDFIIYTDGGCAINPSGPGAYGSVIISTDTGEITELSQGYSSTTNNRMEIMAVIAALEFVKKGSVSLHSDSQYVLNTISGKFRQKKNLDLWEKFNSLCKNFEKSSRAFS